MNKDGKWRACWQVKGLPFYAHNKFIKCIVYSWTKKVVLRFRKHTRVWCPWFIFFCFYQLTVVANQWKTINHKQSARWQHYPSLKLVRSALGKLLPSLGWQSLIVANRSLFVAIFSTLGPKPIVVNQSWSHKYSEMCIWVRAAGMELFYYY